MSKQTVNTGTSANDRTGDSLRTAFTKINANFTELYTALGLDELPLNLGAFEFTGSVITTTDSSSITIDQATNITSDLTVSGDVLPSVAQGGDLGSAARPWRSLYISGSTIYFGSVPVTVDDSGNLLVGGAAVADVGTAAWDNVTGKPTFAEVATSGSYADLSNRPTIPADIGDLSDTGNLLFDGDYGSLTNQPVIPADVGDLTDTGNLLSGASAAGSDGEIQFNSSGEFSASSELTFDPSTIRLVLGGSTLGVVETLQIVGHADDILYLSSKTASAESTHIALNSTAGISTTMYGTVSFGAGAAVDFTNATVTGLSDPSGLTNNDDINITVNNDDSSSYTWNYGNTGNLTFPDATVQTTAYPGPPTGFFNGDTGAFVLPGGNIVFQVDGVSPVAVVNGEGIDVNKITTGASVGGDDLTIVTAAGGNIDIDAATTGNLSLASQSGGLSIGRVGGSTDVYGEVEFNNGTTLFQGGNSVDFNCAVDFSGATVTGLDNLSSEGDINIRVNLTDSTTRVWRFGEDGNLEAPGDIKTGLLNTGGRFVQDCADGTTSMRWINVEEGDPTTQILRVYTGETEDERIERAQLLLNWSGESDEYSGFTIKSFDNTDPENETEHDWLFQGDGGLTFPDSTVQTTAYLGPQTTLDGDVTGSVFSDGSTLLVDGVSGKIVGDVETARLRTSATQIALGNDAGTTGQGGFSVAIGTATGSTDQGSFAVALGTNAGQTNQSAFDIAIGANAGQNDQGSFSIAIGSNAGQISQASYAVALGTNAGLDSQGMNTVAIGVNAGQDSQGSFGIAIGVNAGQLNQGADAIAIGRNAASSNQAANSIVINATTSSVQNTTADSFVVKPVRSAAGTSILQYNSSTGEISHTNDIYSDQQVSITVAGEDSTQKTWYFGNDGDLDAPGSITTTGINSTGEFTINVAEFSGEGTYTFGAANLQLPGGWSTPDLILGRSNDEVVLWTPGAGRSLSLQSNNGSHTWNFGADGSLTVPGDIRSEGNINIDINLSDSTLRRWQFGEDGVLNVPGTIQLSSGALRFPNSTQQTTAYIADNVVQVSTTGGFTDDATTYNLGVYQFKMTSGHLQMRLIAPAGIVQNAWVSTVENINEIISGNNTGLLTLSDSTWTTVTGTPTAAGGDTIVATVVSTQEGKMYRVTAFRSFVSSSHMVSRETLRG